MSTTTQTTQTTTSPTTTHETFTNPLPKPSPDTTMLLSSAVLSRHTSRCFLPRPIPHSTLLAALTLASHAPSNSNIQPWRLFIITGAALTALKTALLAASSSGVSPAIPPLPPAFQHFRSDLGRQVYGEGWGIARSDAEGRRAAVLRNFEFFGAPVAVLACIDRSLAKADVLSLGMYVQTFLLALTERGVASCVEVSVAGYPEVIRECLGGRGVQVPEEWEIVAGIAVGFEDRERGVNGIRVGRVGVEEVVSFVE